MALRRTPLKPGKGLERRTPLRSAGRAFSNAEQPEKLNAGLDFAAAAAALAHQAAPPPEFTGPVPEVSKATPRPSSTGFPTVVRITILERDHYRCARCGRHVAARTVGYSLQHRDNRGMGGTRDVRINWPSNGLTLCGSGTTECHGWVEEHEEEAARCGWVVLSWADPETVPVLTREGWVLLDRSGLSRPTSAPPNGDAHAVARRKERP